MKKRLAPWLLLPTLPATSFKIRGGDAAQNFTAPTSSNTAFPVPGVAVNTQEKTYCSRSGCNFHYDATRGWEMTVLCMDPNQILDIEIENCSADTFNDGTFHCCQPCMSIANAECVHCSHQDTCDEVSCAPGWSNRDEVNENGCETGCRPALGGTCVACTLELRCSAVVCDEFRFDVDNDPANGCEEGCLNVTGGTCNTCDSDRRCGSVTCLPDYMDKDGDPTNGCEVRCPAVPNATCLACPQGECWEMVCSLGYVDIDRHLSNGCEEECSTRPYGRCSNCTNAHDCLALTCDHGHYDDDGDFENGCEAICAPVQNGNCTACSVAKTSDESTCECVVCHAGYADADSNPRNGCEAACPTVEGGNCSSCIRDHTCTKVICAPHRFDIDLDPTNGCEEGCPPVIGGTCTECDDVFECKKIVCDENSADEDGDITNGCEVCLDCPKYHFRTGCPGMCLECRWCPLGFMRTGCGGYDAGWCGTCRKCPAGQKQHGCTEDNRPICEECNECPEGEYRKTCDGECRECDYCPTGQWRTGCLHGDPGTCASCGDCVNGIKVGCSGISTPICKDCGPCAAGQYRTDCPGDCKVCGTCEPGFLRVNCSGWEPGTCVSCGTCEEGLPLTCRGPDEIVCKDCTACPANTFRHACPGTCYECQTCPDGEYLQGCGEQEGDYGEGNCTQCQECPSGQILLGCEGSVPGACEADYIGTRGACMDANSLYYDKLFRPMGSPQEITQIRLLCLEHQEWCVGVEATEAAWFLLVDQAWKDQHDQSMPGITSWISGGGRNAGAAATGGVARSDGRQGVLCIPRVLTNRSWEENELHGEVLDKHRYRYDRLICDGAQCDFENAKKTCEKLSSCVAACRNSTHVFAYIGDDELPLRLPEPWMSGGSAEFISGLGTGPVHAVNETVDMQCLVLAHHNISS